MTTGEILKNNISIYLPSLFFQLGTALTIAFNPLWSRELGADIAMVGIIAAAPGMGNLIFDLPAGWLAGKLRPKFFMALALGGASLCALMTGMARAPWQLLVVGILTGMLTSAWGIGRGAYIRRNVAAHARGRTMGFMGGIIRVSRIAAPVLGGILVEFAGFRPLYFTQSVCIAFSFLSLMIMLKPGAHEALPRGSARKVLRQTFRDNGRNIAAAMIGIGGLMLLRVSRDLLFPLWAAHLGISAAVIGGLTSAGAVAETMMVVPAGHVSDRHGRKWVAVPCTLGFAVGTALLPLTGGVYTLGAVYMLMALSNGIGSGINMTISADLAPKKAAGEFLGIWRFFTDASMTVGPLAAGLIAGAMGLAFAPVAMAAAGLGAGLILLFRLKETSRE